MKTLIAATIIVLCLISCSGSDDPGDRVYTRWVWRTTYISDTAVGCTCETPASQPLSGALEDPLTGKTTCNRSYNPTCGWYGEAQVTAWADGSSITVLYQTPGQAPWFYVGEKTKVDSAAPQWTVAGRFYGGPIDGTNASGLLSGAE